MSKILFTREAVEELSRNPFVKAVSLKGITYTDEFKRIFIAAYEEGKSPRVIFEAHGLRAEILGMERICSSQKRWCKAYRDEGILGLQDGRKVRPGKSGTHELTLEEKNARLKAEILLLKAENELLKNIERAERRLGKKR